MAGFVVVIIAATVTLDVSIRRSWEDSLTQEIQRNLTEKTKLFAQRVEIDREHSLQEIASRAGLAAGARATIIDHEGKVLADSEADATTMENHSHRT
jgi:two-component system phosphate regulon sensor histidine kinase PhoR